MYMITVHRHLQDYFPIKKKTTRNTKLKRIITRTDFIKEMRLMLSLKLVR